MIFALGLDLVELGDSVLRAQRNPRSINRHQLQNSQGSILEMDAETPSKDSLGSLGCFPPPTYESIYGKDECDMPPSYSDILLHRYVCIISVSNIIIQSYLYTNFNNLTRYYKILLNSPINK